MPDNRPWYILPVIVAAQFAGTSLWFAGNAILAGHSGLSAASLTASVQAGFIGGTLVFALLALPDRIAPTLLFLSCALLGASANALIAVLPANAGSGLLALRVATGFFLAGIYPVGMKIASDWYPQGLGKAMGWLVGALVLGTAFPHLLRAGLTTAAPNLMLLVVSLLAAMGGIVLYLLIPRHKASKPLGSIRFGAFSAIWQVKAFRSAAFGYLGHMWELYTFWAFVPVLVRWFQPSEVASADAPLSFAVIATGALGCIAGGYLSGTWGSTRVAKMALVFSGSCCLALPFVAGAPEWLYVPLLLLWGFMVVADSPQLTALAAQRAPAHVKGTALTFLTAAGFALTVFSLLLMQYLAAQFGLAALLVLAPGPLLGALALRSQHVKK